MSTVDDAIGVVDEFVKHLSDYGHAPDPDMVLDCYTQVWSTMYIQSTKNGYGHVTSGPKNEAKPVGPPEDDPIVAALKSMDGWGYPDKIAKALNTTESAIVPLIENAIANGKIYQAKKSYYSLNDKPKK